MKTSSALILYGIVGFFVYKIVSKKRYDVEEEYFEPSTPHPNRNVSWTIEYETSHYRDVVWRWQSRDIKTDARFLIGDPNRDMFENSGAGLTMTVEQTVGLAGSGNRAMRPATYWVTLPEAIKRLDFLSTNIDPSRPTLPPPTDPTPNNTGPNAQSHLSGWGLGASQTPNMSW